jgi:hypothetical protein
VWWDAAQQKWVGYDNVGFSPTKSPDYTPDWSQAPTGMEALDSTSPFIMIADGKSSLFVPSGLKDGPLPTHYEPVESPVRNPLYAQQDNPVAKKWERADNPYHAVADPRYPYVLTTYRLTEHHAGGIPTRLVPSTAELQPQGFAEIPPELAQEKGIGNLDWVVISTARGAVETQALITERQRPFTIDGRRVYQIGMPWHFGWQGYATGDIVNTLSAIVGDPNTTIHEGKAFTCNVQKGRLRQDSKGVEYTDFILPGMIPHEAELTAGVRVEPGHSYGFFTDTTLCIGCKACEVACKEWNVLPADDIGLTGQSYDNTGSLSATTWRHVAFIEHVSDDRPDGEAPVPLAGALVWRACRPGMRLLVSLLEWNILRWCAASLPCAGT